MERKEAIEVIKKNWPDSSFTMLREALETLVPELKENDDERIRKEILNYIIKGSESCYDVQQYGKENFEKWVDWLERQTEQKPAWKPSKEQIEALEHSLGDYNIKLFEDRHKILKSLYNDLKKLKGEEV